MGQQDWTICPDSARDLGHWTAMPDLPTSSGSARGPELRADTRRTRARIADAARRLLDQSAATPAADIAAAAGVSRSTLYRHFPDRDEPARGGPAAGAGRRRRRSPSTALPPGRLGRERPVSLEGIHVFDVVAPAVLPEQLVAEAERIAGCRSASTCSTSTARTCCASPGPSACPSGSRRRSRSARSSTPPASRSCAPRSPTGRGSRSSRSGCAGARPA